MCPEYFAMYLKFCDLCNQEEGLSITPGTDGEGRANDSLPNSEMNLTQAAIQEIKAKMSAHIRSCPECQRAMKWLKGEK